MEVGNDRLAMVYNVLTYNQVNAFALENRPYDCAVHLYSLCQYLVDIALSLLIYMIE